MENNIYAELSIKNYKKENKMSEKFVNREDVQNLLENCESIQEARACFNENNISSYAMEIPINSKSWEKFKNSGLLWWINMILHTFGWEIMYYFNADKEITNVRPRRTASRGFGEDTNDIGYTKVSQYLNEHATELLKDATYGYEMGKQV